MIATEKKKAGRPVVDHSTRIARLKRFENFRENLKMLRAYKGLGKETLSLKLDLLSRNRVHMLETGVVALPRPDEVSKLANFFGVSINQLLYQKATIVFEK